MTIFSTFRKGRQAAKEHKAKQAEQAKKDEVKPAYKHIPSHAAIDSLNATPQAWRAEDAPRIQEANRRHSERAASGYGRVSSFMSLNAAQFHSVPGTPALGSAPRVSSSLSHVTFPSGYHNPVVKMPRTYSVQSLHPPMNGWQHGGGEPVPYLRRADTDGPPVPNYKGKGKAVDRSSAMPDFGRSGANPYSSSDSTSSQDDLEMAGSSKRARAASNASQASMTPKASGQPHRLHPTRRISDPAGFSPTRSTHHLSSRGDHYYPPSASAGRPGPRRHTSGYSPTAATGSASNGIPPVPIPPRGLNTSSSHSLSSSNSDGTNRSAEPADTPATAPSPEISPTQQHMPGSSKFDAEDRSVAETYADIIPDFAPLGFVEPAPKARTTTTEPRSFSLKTQQQTHEEKVRVTNFSRLSIRSNSSLMREAPQPTVHTKTSSNTSPTTAAPAHVQAPAPVRPQPPHSSFSFERSSAKPGSLPTRFIETGFDDPTPAHRPAPQPPTSTPAPAPASKRGKLTKRSSAASAPPKEKEAEKSGAKKSRWGRK